MKMHKISHFAEGLAWNYISIFFLAAGGIVFTFLIGFFYDAQTLGSFYLFYAYYAVLSQAGVWGSHMAVTKYVSEYADDRKMVNVILSCGLTTAVLAVAVFGVLAWIVCFFIIKEMLDEFLFSFIISMVAAVFFFSINKVILGYFNGLSKMKEYAVFQSLRNIFIALFIIVSAVLKVPSSRISFCFFYTEAVLLFLEIPLLIREKFSFCMSSVWMKKIIIFGTHIIPANIVLELSTKLDVLCLSWIISDEGVLGIYSFAALFADGFYQLFVVVRRNINPYITQNYIKNGLKEYYETIAVKIKKIGYPVGILCMAVIAAGYLILCSFMKDASYYAGLPCLVILMASIVCNMKSIIFGNVLSQTGQPAAESLNNILTVLSNLLLNVIFISKAGMAGAALATGTSYFVFSFNQKIMVSRKLRLR